MSSSSNKLAAHIEALRKREASKPVVADDVILYWGTFVDKNYLHSLKACVGSATVFLRLEKVETLTQVAMYCDKKNITRIISSSPSLLEKLLHWDRRAAAKLSNYAGSYFTIPTLDKTGTIEIVFIQPLKQIITVPYGQFMAKRFISKLTNPKKWYKATEFSWELLTASNEEELFWEFSSAFLISVDIETFRENATIRCISYTGFFYNNKSKDSSLESFIGAAFESEPNDIISKSVVLPLDSTYNLSIMRKWNWQLKAPKVFQNGKYDHSYLSRYNAPIYNYLYDTATMFHSWLSELPKDLGFLNAFFLREAIYWKDLSDTTDLHQYYKYNALDTWGTGNALLAMLLELPDWAERNYLKEFPLLFPCHMCEMRGIERDMEVLTKARADADAKVEELSNKLDTILGVKGFNVKSSPQMKSLLKILGCADLKSADEKNLKKVRFRHPFNARIIKLVLDIREARTLKEKYLQIGEKAKEFHRQDGTGNRILYSLNPHGTDTSRLASKEHHFWTGLQIQNIPRGPSVKCTLKADPGFALAEVDLEQAESRDTAYISGEEKLIHNVEFSPDFHCANASEFFGIPFAELYDVEFHKKLNTKIRDLAKNVNHGANYNMGAFVLIDTMGEENIANARKLLGLPIFWSYVHVAEYLLERFHATYPLLKEVFYEGIKTEIRETGLLVHHTYEYVDGELVESPGLTRRCFGNPDKNKPHLNAYIAHPPQSLNAQTLNRAFMKVFHTIAMNPKYADNFKLNAQIHDSILFQYRIGHDYLCGMVKDCMEIPVTIKAYDGKIRTFTVPAGIKAGKEGKLAIYWSETE